MSFSIGERIPPGAISVTSVCASAVPEPVNRIATAATAKDIRLMGWISNVEGTFDSCDKHESRAGIVALFCRMHNHRTRSGLTFHLCPANQSANHNNQPLEGCLCVG